MSACERRDECQSLRQQLPTALSNAERHGNVLAACGKLQFGGGGVDNQPADSAILPSVAPPVVVATVAGLHCFLSRHCHPPRRQVVTACGELGNALKPYQLVGINFLMLLNSVQNSSESSALSASRGAILADEMGARLSLRGFSFFFTRFFKEGWPLDHPGGRNGCAPDCA